MSLGDMEALLGKGGGETGGSCAVVNRPTQTHFVVAFDPAAAWHSLSVFRRRFSFAAAVRERERWDRAIKEQRTHISFRGKFSALTLKLGGVQTVSVCVNRASGYGPKSKWVTFPPACHFDFASVIETGVGRVTKNF